jgi:hypothetical protein
LTKRTKDPIMFTSTKENDMAHTDNFWIGLATLAVVGTMLINAAITALI